MSKFKYRQTGKVGFFDREAQKTKLTRLGNPLEKLHKVIDFEMFRMELEDSKKKTASLKPLRVSSKFLPFLPESVNFGKGLPDFFFP